MLPTASTLPLDLLITVLSFLELRVIATCACVSRRWAEAAGVAVPTVVDMDPNDRQAFCCLLRKPHLGTVESVTINLDGGFEQGVLFGRICAEATALRECHLVQ